MSGDPSPLSLTADASGVRFFIHVTPGARSARIGPAHGDALRLTVIAPPESGKANAACARALAEALGVARSDVTLDPASRGRRKRVRIEGDPEDLSARLHALAIGEGLR